MRATFAGVKADGHIDSGDLYLHEVDEFVESCKSSGWRSVAVAADCRIIRRWRRAV